MGALSGRPRATDRGDGTFTVGPHGAVLVDWYPQLAARAHGRWDRAEVGSVGDVGHADPGAAVVALTVPKGWRVAGAGAALGQHAVSAAKEMATLPRRCMARLAPAACSPSRPPPCRRASGLIRGRRSRWPT